MLPHIKGLCRTWQNINWCMVLAALAAQSINISVGFCQGFSAILLPQLKNSTEYSALTSDQGSWIASMGVISNPVGALIGGVLVDAIGRKLLLQSILLPNLLGWLVIAFCDSYVYLCVGRFITGFTIGMSTVSYIYVAEVTTPERRGVLSAVGPGLVSAGIFVVYALGAFVHWKKVAAICAAVSLLTPFLMHFSPESPLWLASKGRMKEAYAAMMRLRQNSNTAQQELMEFNKVSTNSEQMTIRQKMSMLSKKCVLKSYILLMVFFVFQELSGIYVILYYAVDFFKAVETNVDEFTASIIVGGVRVLMGAVGAVLIDNFRRKTLAAASGLLLGASMLAAAVCDSLGGPSSVVLACVLAHVSFSMVGFLQLPWIMSGELYPQEARGLMSGATACCAYLLIFVNIKTYPWLVEKITNNGTLYLFSLCSLLGAVFCCLFLPETKGKSLSELMRQLEGDKKTEEGKDSEEGGGMGVAQVTKGSIQRRNSAASIDDTKTQTFKSSL